MGDRVVRQHDAPAVVGAQVEPDLVAHGQDGPVAPRGDLDVVRLVARVAGAHHVLAPVLRPLHGAPRRDGGDGDELVLGVAARLGTEAPAHVGRDDADLVGRKAERRDQPLLDEVRHLRAVPRGQRAVALIPLRDHAARLDGHPDVALDVEALAHGDVRGGEGRVGVAEARLEEDRDVVAPLGIEDVRAGQGAGDHVRHDGQRLVLDLDQVAGVFGEGAALRQSHGHDLADVAHAVARHGELAELLHLHVHARGEPGRNGTEERERLHPALEISEREDVGDARQAARRLGLHRRDPGVAVRAPDEGRVEQARQLDVVDVAAFTPEKARVFRAADGGSEVLGAHGDARPYQQAGRLSRDRPQCLCDAGISPLAMAR